MAKEKIPLSCPHTGFVESRLRRIREWAEEYEHFEVEEWASEAYRECDKIRRINRALRKAARA